MSKISNQNTLSKACHETAAHVKKQMFTLQATFEDLVIARENKILSFKGAKELQGVLFGDIIDYMRTDFVGFVKYATRYLTWDIFCGISPRGISLKLVRERQLYFWMKYWEKGVELPLGKIVDDLANHHGVKFQSHFKEYEDMVDAEMHTYLIMGYKNNGECRPINALVYFPPDLKAFEKRNELILTMITNLEKRLQKTLIKRPGRLYILDPKTHTIQGMQEPVFKIEL